MTKKHFIALANVVKSANAVAANMGEPEVFNREALLELASFCRSQNSSFKRERWFDYIAGECGPNGGTVLRDKLSK